MPRKRPRTRANPVLREFVRRVKHQWALTHRDLDNGLIGARMAEFLGRDHPYTRQEVSDYLAGKVQPRFTIGCALAWAIGADPMAMARAYLDGGAQQEGETAADS